MYGISGELRKQFYRRMVLWGGADLITTRKFTQNISFAFDFQELLKYARKNDSQNKFAMPKNNCYQ